MSTQPAIQLVNAERRQYTERRRVCLLAYTPGKSDFVERRSGFDRRLVIKLTCPSCSRLLFATRDSERRLVLSDRFHRYLSGNRGKPYYCPFCGTPSAKTALQLQQEQMLLERLHFD